MSTTLGPGLNSYVNVDSFADFMVENNMSSVIELGFMPRWLAGDGFSCNHSTNHYRGCSDPPSNFTQWGEVVHELYASGNRVFKRDCQKRAQWCRYRPHASARA